MPFGRMFEYTDDSFMAKFKMDGLRLTPSDTKGG